MQTLDLPALCATYLPKRDPIANKGDFGHVVVVGGDVGFSGAVRLAGEAAYRVGAGLVTVLTHPQHASVLNVTRPELMCRGVLTARELKKNLARATVVVFGPGLGQSTWSQRLFKAFSQLKLKLPMVWDADGLNALAKQPQHRDHWILTPHPGEAARLLGQTTPSIQQPREVVVRALQKKYGGVVVLKGQHSLICGKSLSVCPFGNPGMATAGMGDVLSGVIGGLLAQQIPLEVAAGLGVYLHAKAGDRAAESGERGLLASDLMIYLRSLVNDDQTG